MAGGLSWARATAVQLGSETPMAAVPLAQAAASSLTGHAAAGGSLGGGQGRQLLCCEAAGQQWGGLAAQAERPACGGLHRRGGVGGGREGSPGAWLVEARCLYVWANSGKLLGGAGGPHGGQLTGGREGCLVRRGAALDAGWSTVGVI